MKINPAGLEILQNSLDIIRAKAAPLDSAANVAEEILSLIGEARFVLLGERLARFARILSMTRRDYKTVDRRKRFLRRRR